MTAPHGLDTSPASTGGLRALVRTKMFTGRLAQTIHAYPTWSMAIQQAATGFFFDTVGVEVRPARPDGAL